LEVCPDQIVVHLMPRVNYPPRLRRILATVLEGINAQTRLLQSGRCLTKKLANFLGFSCACLT
jgi:hypothetical protein